MSTVRLWDNEFRFLVAQEDCPPPTAPGRAEVVIPGRGKLHQFIKQQMIEGLSENIHMTIDLTAAEYQAGSRRIGGIVTKLTIVDRPCECGNGRIIETTITGYRHA